jgi:hypothetical protein
MTKGSIQRIFREGGKNARLYFFADKISSPFFWPGV